MTKKNDDETTETTETTAETTAPPAFVPPSGPDSPVMSVDDFMKAPGEYRVKITDKVLPESRQVITKLPTGRTLRFDRMGQPKGDSPMEGTPPKTEFKEVSLPFQVACDLVRDGYDLDPDPMPNYRQLKATQ